jgi:hypothetical protein
MKFCSKSDQKSSGPSIYLQKLLHFLENSMFTRRAKGKFFHALLCNLSSWEMARRRLFVRLIAEKPRVRICERLWSPGIDSEESIPLAYVSWWAGTTIRIVVPARQAGNRFLGTLKGFQIRALAKCCQGAVYKNLGVMT